MIVWFIVQIVGMSCIIACMIWGWGLTPKSWIWVIVFYFLAGISHLAIWKIAIKLVNKWSAGKPWPPKDNKEVK